MKQALGFFLFLVSFSAFSKTATLILRGRVPASTSVEYDQKTKKAILHSNSDRSGQLFKITKKRDKNFIRVSVIQR